MSQEGFLQSADDGQVEIIDPVSEMPGLAGHIQNKFEDSENGRRTY